MRIAVLDDYLDVATSLADWSLLPDVEELVVFTEHIADPDELVARLQRFDVVSIMRERTALPADVLDRLPNLRLLVTTGRRNDAVDIGTATANGVVVCGTRSRGQATAELAWALLLATVRALPQHERAVRGGGWHVSLGDGLFDKRLGILGLGRVGTTIAGYGNAFGMEVVAWSANLTADAAQAGGATLVSKEELLSTSDVVTIHLKLSDRTRGLIGREELALLRPDAYLINTSRSRIVDTAALTDALREGRIAGAGLDVHDREPLAADDPMLTLDNVVLTPHLGYTSRESFGQYYTDTVEDIAAWCSGNPVRVLNPDVLG